MQNSIKNLFIMPDTPIKDAMQTISKAAQLKLPVGITLVIDSEDRLIGTVTDGDIRKALVAGVNLEEPVNKIMAKDPITVDEGLTIEGMIKTVTRKVRNSGRIRDYKVDQVIVTNKDDKVIDVFDFYELWYKQDIRYKNVCIIGTGHVGLTLSVALAEAGYQILGFDTDKGLVDKLNSGRATFYEEGLQPLLKLHLKEGNIKFTDNLKKERADVYMICVGTPVDEITQQSIMDGIKKTAEDVGNALKKDDVVILRSTVPVGTTRNLVLPILEEKSALKAGIDFYLVFAPERVVEGKALEETKEIPQIIGGINNRSAQEASRVFQAVNPSIIILDSLEEAEMVKLINNTFRDLSFAFANKITLICDKLNLDSVKIIKAANEGYPRNPISLPSPGVGGYCLKKDSYLMAEVANNAKIDPDIFLQSRKINNEMPNFVSNKVSQFLEINWKKEPKIKIYLMGFAFKGYPETSDMRGSPTLDVLNILREKFDKRANFCGYDSVVKKDEIELLNVNCLNYKEGFRDAHCVLIMNNNPEFAKIDIFNLLETMAKPGFLFDGWYFFLPKEITRVKGIIYQGLGGGF